MTRRWHIGLLAVGTGAAVLAAALAPARAQSAATQAWPPFVLVAGLLLVGLVAQRDGLFDLAAAAVERLPGPPVVLLLACCLLVAVVTAVLNLDTAAVFLTPVLIGVARRRGVSERPFLYGAVFMANASSLFLPGSNLTNLLVLRTQGMAGATFARHMLAPALAATLATALLLALLHLRDLRAAPARAAETIMRATPLRPGLAGALAAAVFMVVLANPALPVLAVGIATVAAARARGALQQRDAVEHVGVPMLLGVLGVAVGLGTLARAWSVPGHVMHSAGQIGTAWVAAGVSIAVNNLPAAVLLSAHPAAHPRALLIGLNVGPNLAMTGSLSAVLWLGAAYGAGAQPSARTYARLGLALAPAALFAALGAAALA